MIGSIIKDLLALVIKGLKRRTNELKSGLSSITKLMHGIVYLNAFNCCRDVIVSDFNLIGLIWFDRRLIGNLMLIQNCVDR